MNAKGMFEGVTLQKQAFVYAINRRWMKSVLAKCNGYRTCIITIIIIIILVMAPLMALKDTLLTHKTVTVQKINK